MPAPWTVADAVTVVLAAAAVILTGVAIMIGLGAWLGYRDIKDASIKAAEAEARRVAEDVAQREIRAFLDKQSGETDISQAYRDTAP